MGAGISEPLPVAATFYTPSASGHSMEKYAAVDTMVCSSAILTSLLLATPLYSHQPATWKQHSSNGWAILGWECISQKES